MKKLIRSILPLSLLFVVSTGFAQGRNEQHQNKAEKGKKDFEQLKSELDLTDDQIVKVKALYQERNEKLKANRPSKQKLKDLDEADKKELKMKQMKLRKQLNEELQVKLAEILDEEQLARIKEISTEWKMEMKQDHEHHKLKQVEGHEHSEGSHQH